MVAELRAEDLLAEARERTGLANFGDPSYREGLDVLLGDLARAELHDLGRMVWRGRILAHLSQRLLVEDWLARHPEIEFVKAPYLNDHPLVIETFVYRVREILEGQNLMNCSRGPPKLRRLTPGLRPWARTLFSFFTTASSES